MGNRENFKRKRQVEGLKRGVLKTRQAISETRNAADEVQESKYATPVDYATSKVEEGGRESVGVVKSQVSGQIKQVRKNFIRTREGLREVRREREVRQTEKPQEATNQARNEPEKPRKSAEQPNNRAKASNNSTKTADKPVNSARSTHKTVRVEPKATRASVNTTKIARKSTKVPAKVPVKTIKTATKSVKTSAKTAKVAAKSTAKATAKATAATTKASAKATAVTAKAATKASVVATKVTIKAAVAAVKATIAAVKGLIAAIAAGGWVVIVVVLVICLVGLLLGSVFGIFFSGEDDGFGRTMPDVVNELTLEFYGRIEEIKANNPHDIEVVMPMSINWSEVLAVYAVRVNMGSGNSDDEFGAGADVVTLDDEKIGILREIFNEMVSLSYSLTTHEEERTRVDEDGEEITETVEVVTLTISMTQKTSAEMAAELGFNDEQNKMLAELLSPEFTSLWNNLLGGYAAGNGEILISNPNFVPNGALSWPLAGDYPVTSRFGNRRDPFTGRTRFHGGIDIPAPEGTPILAAADGVVVVANGSDSWGGGWGFYVRVRHERGIETLYAHCVRIAVRVGQEVRQGEVIAFVGTTGRSTGNHLHWEVYRDGVRVDPLGFFD